MWISKNEKIEGKAGNNGIGTSQEEERVPNMHLCETPALKRNPSGGPGWRVDFEVTR